MKTYRLACLAVGAAFWAAPMHEPVFADDRGRLTFTVDVAEDFSQFVYTPVIPGDIPQRGSTFVTEGNLFPRGTIEGDGATFDPNAAGAIGKWYCRGIHLVSAADIPGAPLWVDTAQLFQLPDHGRSLSTDGLEGSVPVLRAVIGGTGSLKNYVGQQKQEFLGFNATGGVNLRVTFVLRRAAR
jgi:hypothetical protein